MSGSFDILETLALKNGQWQHWPLHWARLQITAQHFGYPLQQALLEGQMRQLAQQHPEGDWRVRLALQATGAVHITAQPLLATPEPVKLELASQPLANVLARGDKVRFKTTVRGHYEQFQPRSAAAFDVILYNEDGQITECTRGNIAMELDGRWVTPPISCGLLPGVGRGLAISQGRLVEQIVHLDDVPRITGWAFVNSLRGWLDGQLVSG